MEDVNIIMNTETQCLIVEHLYTVENYLTFNIQVKSGGFAGQSNFCISKEKIGEIIQSLEEAYEKLSGRSQIDDYDSDAHLVIKATRLGKVTVSGQIGGSHQEHSMRFEFTSDQTVLERLINLFNVLIR
ncbi:hypothetical protein NQ117_16805 [Paenibacillus sp. SC116]|uniref:WapI family immunity protein n=1 Tax=Paenibacillus sp. SC116 TaxID=2968986 RepID=UPI00215ADB5D|nr:hypothetical protein [Paenibacillus sp. SC116]MCR8845343.1 hypothetical protein [Paenibacillus sp. SC116]